MGASGTSWRLQHPSDISLCAHLTRSEPLGKAGRWRRGELKCFLEVREEGAGNTEEPWQFGLLFLATVWDVGAQAAAVVGLGRGGKEQGEAGGTSQPLRRVCGWLTLSSWLTLDFFRCL